MPKKRSVARGYNKSLQRLHKRASFGPSLPPEETPDEQPAPATAVPATPKTQLDIQRMMAAAEKRKRKAARNLHQS